MKINMYSDSGVRAVAAFLGRTHTWVYNKCTDAGYSLRENNSGVDQRMLVKLFRQSFESQNMDKRDYSKIAKLMYLRKLETTKFLTAIEQCFDSGNQRQLYELLIAKKAVTPKYTVSNMFVLVERTFKGPSGREAFNLHACEQFYRGFLNGALKLQDLTGINYGEETAVYTEYQPLYSNLKTGLKNLI